MTKVIMNGCNGHMGHVISDLCEKDAEIEIVAGIDINTEQHYGYPVFASIGDCDMTADAIIDWCCLPRSVRWQALASAT